MTFGIVASSGPLAVVSYADVVLADSPVLYFKLNESSGSVAADSSGNGNDTSSSLTPPTWGITGPISGDTAADFDGSNDRLNVFDNDELDGLTALTLEAWIKTTTTATRQILTRQTTGVVQQFQWRVSSGKLQFVAVWDGVVTVSSSASVNDGDWHHVATTWSTTNGFTNYIDGSQDGTGALGTAMSSGTGGLRIAHRGVSPLIEYFPGGIAHIAIYQSELSSARISAHYNAA